MKKLIAFLLAVLMLASMGVSALADGDPAATPGPSGGLDIGGEEGSPIEDIQPVPLPVTGTYEAPAADGTIYQVRLEWSGLSFIYHPATKGTWNPEHLQYEGGDDTSKWTSGDSEPSGSITLTNHSNAQVSYTIKAAMNTGTVGGNVLMRYSYQPDMSGDLRVPSLGLTGTLYEAEENEPGGSVTYHFLPNGTPTPNFGSAVQIGTITVTVSAAVG